MNSNSINRSGFSPGSKLFCLLVVLLLQINSGSLQAQSEYKGKVTEKTADGSTVPLPGASVFWLNDFTGGTTDAAGEFSIPEPHHYPSQLVISFVGFTADTVTISNKKYRTFTLQSSLELQTVEIAARREAIGISTIQTINAEKITEKELLKAACCNLSEAFETSPTVNVAYKDAVTGAKEIQLLGLSGTYSQLLTENIPSLYGVGRIYGLNYIPGPWMESIQVTKGSGSVLHGYESTTGQVNIEFKKPDNDEVPRFYLNLFGEANSNAEINTHFRKKLNDKLSSILMLHGNYMNAEEDHNHDGFLDIPKTRQVNIYNRWQYHQGNKLEAQLGLKFLSDRREGGQLSSVQPDALVGKRYSSLVESNRAEAFAKVGLIYPENPFRSIGNIAQVTWHDMKSNFGLRNYNATQKNLYLQSIYQDIFGEINHQFRTGFTFRYDELKENFVDKNLQLTEVSDEKVIGAFFEYTYHYLDELTLIGGVREDYHDDFGWVFTPRFHGKYNFTPNLIVRASAGRSFRRPYRFADNISIMASSKSVKLLEEARPERAWNYGTNLTGKFELNNREGSLVLDYYRTEFENQLVMDAYSDSSAILFYNLNGSSFSNSFQVTLNYELLNKLDVRLAYKLDDVKITYLQGLERKPLISRNKALMNIAFASNNDHWKFDYTLIWDGEKRLPRSPSHHHEGNADQVSPDFFIMHLQVTKVFRKFELYAGTENLLNFRQDHPILSPEDPFGENFDATRIWGPVDGRRIYAGLRYSFL